MNSSIKVLLELDEKYTLIYNESNKVTPYNVALEYDETTKSWACGHYCSSLKAALKTWLKVIDDKEIKGAYQQQCEEATDISYMRLCELAGKFKDGLIEDDETEAWYYFTEECEMDEVELDWFGIDKPELLIDDDLI